MNDEAPSSPLLALRGQGSRDSSRGLLLGIRELVLLTALILRLPPFFGLPPQLKTLQLVIFMMELPTTPASLISGRNFRSCSSSSDESKLHSTCTFTLSMTPTDQIVQSNYCLTSPPPLHDSSIRPFLLERRSLHSFSVTSSLLGEDKEIPASITVAHRSESESNDEGDEKQNSFFWNANKCFSINGSSSSPSTSPDEDEMMEEEYKKAGGGDHDEVEEDKENAAAKWNVHADHDLTIELDPSPALLIPYLRCDCPTVSCCHDCSSSEYGETTPLSPCDTRITRVTSFDDDHTSSSSSNSNWNSSRLAPTEDHLLSRHQEAIDLLRTRMTAHTTDVRSSYTVQSFHLKPRKKCRYS